MLFQRIITAVVLIPLVIMGIFYLPPLAFDLLVLLLILIAVWEFLGLYHWGKYKRIGFLVIASLIIVGIELIWRIPSAYLLALMLTYKPMALIWAKGLLILLAAGVLWWLITPYFLWRYTKVEQNLALNPVLLGALIFMPCWVSLVMLSSKELCLLLAIVWAADIGAYFVGSSWGKHRIAPKISPHKTIEGVGGGVIASLGVTAIFIFLEIASNGATMKLNKIIALLTLAIVVSIWSVIGDLFESMLKRRAGVKDSSKLLPGHGGMYDRLDSLTAAAPVFTLGYLLIINV